MPDLYTLIKTADSICNSARRTSPRIRFSPARPHCGREDNTTRFNNSELFFFFEDRLTLNNPCTRHNFTPYCKKTEISSHEGFLLFEFNRRANIRVNYRGLICFLEIPNDQALCEHTHVTSHRRVAEQVAELADRRRESGRTKRGGVDSGACRIHRENATFHVWAVIRQPETTQFT